MIRGLRALLLVALLAALWLFRAQLFAVSRPGQSPRALQLEASRRSPPTAVDVVLPVVPIGLQRLSAQGEVMLVHYWAPWEKESSRQILALDSLGAAGGLEAVRVAVVCFDPFPSVARYVARRRVRTPVLLDGQHLLRRSLPCPSIPFTYVLDRAGHIAIAQPGTIDWLSPATRAVLDSLVRERRLPKSISASDVEFHPMADLVQEFH